MDKKVYLKKRFSARLLYLDNQSWLLDPYRIIIESKYCKYFPDFVNHVSENLRDLLGEFSENLYD